MWVCNPQSCLLTPNVNMTDKKILVTPLLHKKIFNLLYVLHRLNFRAGIKYYSPENFIAIIPNFMLKDCQTHYAQLESKNC